METPVQRSYIFDTSAFRAIPAATLEAASHKAHLVVSPFCFWELLTHLEDDGQFDRVKGNLMKFRHMSVLDDPWASDESNVVLPDDDVLKRPDDSGLIYAILAALHESHSIPQFYTKRARDSRGQVREIDECVARAAEILKAEEQRFQEYVSNIMSVVRDGRVSLATPADRHRGTIQVVDAWWIQLAQRVDGSELVRRRLEERTYVFSLYVLHLAADYVKRGSTNVDRNDFEDGKFCQHLTLDAEMTAVTADVTLQRCLENTLAVLKALPDLPYRTDLQVRCVSDFMSLSWGFPK
jgi:hypothetical protein